MFQDARALYWEVRNGWEKPRNFLPRLIRWPIALWMNRHSDTCWADLVMWAVRPQHNDFGMIFEQRYTSSGCGYCGKDCDTCLIQFSDDSP